MRLVRLPAFRARKARTKPRPGKQQAVPNPLLAPAHYQRGEISCPFPIRASRSPRARRPVGGTHYRGGRPLYCAAGRLGPSLAAAIAALVSAFPAPAAATDWSAAQTITVVAKEYRFKPKQLIFQRGVAYRLHIDHRGKEPHEFHCPEF